MQKSIQRYRCKKCHRIFLSSYTYKANQPNTSKMIAACVKEGLGIRGIARLLNIAISTVIARIRKIAASINKPAISTRRVYEVDELRTFVGNKTNTYWVIYALDKETRAVADFKVGKRAKANLKLLTDTLVLSGATKIYTDGLNIYQQLLGKPVHRVRRYGTNRIEPGTKDYEAYNLILTLLYLCCTFLMMII